MWIERITHRTKDIGKCITSVENSGISASISDWDESIILIREKTIQVVVDNLLADHN